MDASNKLQNGTEEYLSMSTATDLPDIAGYTVPIVPSLTAVTNTITYFSSCNKTNESV
jgi:hypothetical protein